MSDTEDKVIDMTKRIREDQRVMIARLIELYQRARANDDGRRLRRRHLEIDERREN